MAVLKGQADTLTFHDYLLAARGFFFYAAVLWEVLVSPALSKPSWRNLAIWRHPRALCLRSWATRSMTKRGE